MVDNEYIGKILHELDHQKMEVIGVEKMADDCSLLIGIIMVNMRQSGLSVPQLLAVTHALPKLIKTQETCDACIELGERIETQILKDFHEFVEEQKK